MKTILAIIATALGCLSPVIAADPPKPLVTLTVKKQTLDSDHDLRGKRGSTGEKTLTLRVEITNITGATIEASQLAGDALILRAGDVREKLVKESLGSIPVPALKPNARVTLDLGTIHLHNKEWKNRKFEESLEEWQAVCTRDRVEIGKAASSDRYEARAREIAPPARQKKATPGAKKKAAVVTE